MFRRARLSVKPNVRPGVGSRGSAATNPPRGPDTPRRPEAPSARKPAEAAEVPPGELGGAEPQEETPRDSDDKKTDGENEVEESSKSSSAVSQRKKRVSSTSSLVKPDVSIPLEPNPLPTVNQEAPQPNSSPAKEKQPCSDRYRIYKAQKLREMLKEELRKEKKQWKNKYAINESQRPPDRSKMTMRDFIYYLPDNNPMTSSLEQEKKTEKSLTPAQTREQEGKSAADAEDNDEIEEETDDGPLLVPRVKVAEDGSIILDEESLTVEVLRTKGPCVVEENDPIFERGSTTTYSSFRKNYYSKPWSNKETDMFFLAISMVGTDFSMIGQLFPHRARIEIKNKFKREEKTNGWRIDKAFQEKRPFDFDFFAHLLQKVLAEEEKRKQKSIRNQNVSKKSSKPRKSVKGKKIASEGVNDDPDESMSTKVSDTESSLQDVQTVSHSVADEEQQALPSPGQNLEQTVSEPDPNQKKKRKKSQEEASIPGNVSVQSDPSKGEKHKNKCHSLKPEIDEGEGNKEQTLSCTQNLDDIVGFSSDGKVEKRIDPVLSSSTPQDAISVENETLESGISELPSPEAGIHALCLVDNTEINSIEERNVDSKSKTLEIDQTENVKPAVRGRFQRPKPNLSRAVGKKAVLSQGKADAESKSLPSEAPVGKNNMEKNKMNTFDISGMENPEKENPEAETVSNSSEKAALQEGGQPKALRPARLMRGRLPRPRPNVGKAAERKETSASQGKSETDIEKNENAPGVDKDVRTLIPHQTHSHMIPEQTEDQSCKNFECEQVTSQSEKIQPDVPKILNECLSSQEDNNANLLKQVPVLKTHFQKPKPNTQRSVGRKEIFSKEEVPTETLASEEMTVSLVEIAELETSTRENVPVETDMQEMESDFKEAEGRDTSPGETIPEMSEGAVEMETDLKETARESSPGKKVPEMTDTPEDKKTDLEETGKGEPSLQEDASEETSALEVETVLKEIGKGNSPREEEPVEISPLEERETPVKENEKADFSPRGKASGEMAATEETAAYSKETGGEISCRQSRPEEINTTEEMVADLGNTGKIDISRDSEPKQMDTSRHTDTDLIQTSGDDSGIVPSQNVENISSEVLPVVTTSVEEKANAEKEASGPSHHSSRASGLDKTEEQGWFSPHTLQLCPDVILRSRSLPQEQKPLEVKAAPFVRSRFKKPKPNLTRAALKRETNEGEKSLPGRTLEADTTKTVVIQQNSEERSANKTKTVVIQQNSEERSALPSQHDVTSVMTPGEKDRPRPRQEEAAMPQCVLTEVAPAVQAWEDESRAPAGTHNVNTLQEEEKGCVPQTALPVRGRLQRPRPNVRKAGLRQIGKGDSKGMLKDEKVLQKEETENKFLIVANSPNRTEVEVVASKVSECSLNVVSDEKRRHEHKTHAPQPTQLMRKQFQKAKPNPGKEYRKQEEPCLDKDRADQSEAGRPEAPLLQRGDCDIQLLQKEKAKLLVSLEVSARRDGANSQETGLAVRGAESDAGAAGDSAVPSAVEEQGHAKPTSSSQLLKESNYSKVAPDRKSTTVSSASEYEVDRSERKIHRKIKPNVTKGRASKRVRSKPFRKEPRTSKAVLVTLRASQEEDEDDAEDFEPDYEEESCQLAPEELSKAPVFVPVGLRSPEPVSSQIEETMEELEITVNVPDLGCIAVVEHPLSNADVTTQEMKPEDNLNAFSIEIPTGEHTQEEAGANDGSTEAAITLLTMGDLVLQSEITAGQSDDNVNYKIVHEYQGLSSTVDSPSLASLEENNGVLEERNVKETVGLMEEVQEDTLPTRDTTSEVTSNLRMSSSANSKLNLKILGTSRLGAHQEVPNLLATKGEVVTQRESEQSTSKATELEGKTLDSVATPESKEQRKLVCVHGPEESGVPQETSLTERCEAQEGGSQEVHILSFAPVESSETGAPTLDAGDGLADSAAEDYLCKDARGDGVLSLLVPECTPTGVSEARQEDVVSSHDLTVVTNVHQGGEDDHTFILTLVEIPTNAVEEFTDTATQLMPNSLLPAPILIKSANTEERDDVSMSFPATAAGPDGAGLSNSGRDGPERPPANVDLTSRKRFRCRVSENDHVPPAKKSPLSLRDSFQQPASEVCSKELNAFEKTEEFCKEQDSYTASGSSHLTPESQKEQLEPPAFQSLGSTSIDKITDTHVEKKTSQKPQDEMVVSDQSAGTSCASEHTDGRTSLSKAPLSRPGRRPLGFLSLICTKNSLESDEPAHVHSKKRLKPLIPVSRQNLKRSNPLNERQKTVQESSDLRPFPSVVTSPLSENVSSSTTQVSCDHPSVKEECKNDQTRPTREEPTSVSEYFFSDIFIEVDEAE